MFPEYSLVNNGGLLTINRGNLKNVYEVLRFTHFLNR
jgi:hypothetical protein